MTDWKKPAWQREPHLLVGCYRIAVGLVDAGGVFSLAALHAIVKRSVGCGYAECETRDCLAFMVDRGDLAVVGDAGLEVFGPGPKYPRLPDRGDV